MFGEEEESHSQEQATLRIYLLRAGEDLKSYSEDEVRKGVRQEEMLVYSCKEIDSTLNRGGGEHVIRERQACGWKGKV